MNATTWIAGPTDAAHCRKLELEAYGKAATIKQWQKLLATPTACVLATANAVAVTVLKPTGYHLLLVAVKRSARRQGIGGELVRMLGDGKQKMQLRLPETAIGALKFATATGFRPVAVEREGYSDCDAILLERQPNQ